LFGAGCLAVGVAIGAAVSPLVRPERPAAAPTPGPALVEPTATPTNSPLVLVHVSGAVKLPGVYELREGQRVRDALAAAGGSAEGADPDGLNLAAPLKDGQHLVVPSLTATPRPPGTPVPSAATPLNLNTASEAELEALPGIGPVTAQRTVRYRVESGDFTS